MTVRLEHANLSVHDIDAIIRFLQSAFPEFRIRHDKREPDGSRWVHVGTDDTYVALNQIKAQQRTTRRGSPLNHLAYEVTDVEAVRSRLSDAGYQENTLVPNAHPHRKRLYFYDPEGNEWEFVQYLSDDAAKRNDYTLEVHMKRVTGIGGIFFKAKDAPALHAWYKRHLGIDVQAWGGAAFTWADADGKPTGGTTIWSVGPAEGEQFAPSNAPFMINYRVEDLHNLVAVLKGEGCNVLDKIDDSEYGKFAWVIDPEGNKVELWQPPAGQ